MRRLSERMMQKMTVAGLAVCLMVTLAGCGSSSDSAKMTSDSARPAMAVEYNSAAMDMGGAAYPMEELKMEETVAEAEVEEAGAAGMEVDDSAANVQSDRKLIKTVDMNVETKEFDLVMSTLEQQVTEMGGYIESMETYNGSAYAYYQSTRNAHMTIRIPKEKLDSFLDTVSGISNVVRRSEYVEDVTLAYVDLESHRNALRTEQTRLLELMEKAESIDDIIVIEQRLSEVRYELESMESQLRTYDNQVDYSTVYLYVEEVEDLTPVEEENAWERVTGGFVDSVWSIGDGLKEFCIWFAIHIPYMVVWGVVITVIVLIVKKIVKRKRSRKAKGEDTNE